MNWPLASDYQDAIQNPKQCFQDPQLQTGQVVLNRLGLPRVASGMFASVYEMRSGAQSWAVRCFLRPSADQREIYGRLSAYLDRIQMPGLVGFAYQPEGIRVRGQWYPIVKMEWVAGVTLHTYIGKHLQEPDVLRKLARQWRSLLDKLRQNHIAHADLQHGNVLVTPTGELRLVDYDGMFVPSLRGQPSHELGHPNYQHPQRTAQSYDEHLDNFAALVIYTSLVALIYDPGLWDKFHTGENLIFSESDFKAPQKSAVFERLYRSSEPLVRELSQKLAQACEGVIWRVPDFTQTVAALPDLPTPTPWWHDPQAPISRPQSARGAPETVPVAPPPTGRTPVKQPVTVVPTPSSHATPSSSHASNLPEEERIETSDETANDDWWKPAQESLEKTPAGKAMTGFWQPFKRLWEEAGASASIPANPSRGRSSVPVPLERGVPRAHSKNRRSSRWMTCSSLTCVLLCLTLFGVGMLASLVTHTLNRLFVETKQNAAQALPVSTRATGNVTGHKIVPGASRHHPAAPNSNP